MRNIRPLVDAPRAGPGVRRQRRRQSAGQRDGEVRGTPADRVLV